MRLIVAHGKNLEIGKNNSLPWRLRKDLAYFSKVTKESSFLICGRKTLESIPGKMLPGRKIVVVSSGYKAYHDEVIVDSPEKALAMNGSENAIVIGGATIYNSLINLCSELLITRVDLSVKDADTFFPEYDSKFALDKTLDMGFENNISYKFERWIKKTL